MKYNPKPYQVRTSKFITNTLHCAIHIDMGLGKTVATMTAYRNLLDSFDVTSVFILAPLRVSTITWPDEIAKWDHLKDTDFVVVRGTPTERERLLSEYHEVYLLGYEITDWFVEWIIANKKKVHSNAIIFDESSKLKSHKSIRFKMLKPLLRSNLFKRVVEMTGTPMPERYENLWSQYFLLDGGERLSEFVTHFTSRYFDKNPYNPHKLDIRPDAPALIQAKIADITLTLLADDYLDLPKVTVSDMKVYLPPKVRKFYNQLEKEMIAAINEQEIVAPVASSVVEKCRQITAGFVYDGGRVSVPLHTAKMDALTELIDTLDGNLLVAYHYGWEETEIRRRWPKAPILGSRATDKESHKYITDWNKGKHTLMFMHPQSVGHGLNLQDGGYNLCFLTPPWSGETYDQTIARVQRMGQTNRVTIHRIIVDDSVDSRVYKTLASKNRTQADMMRALTRAEE